MKQLIRISLLLCALLTGVTANSATPYDVTARKADRFFSYGEWASASAMYSLMLDERTDSARVFGNAIIAAGMTKQPEQQIELFTRALDAHQPIDSVLRATEQAALRADSAALYEQFLYTVRQSDPWLSRVIDSKLLSYYLFRDNGPGIVTLSRVMLEGLPDNERFLYSLARGQMLCDDIPSAIDTYRHINSLYPGSLDALLFLGNYYATREPELARGYLQKALDIRWTPYIAAKLSKLEHPRH